MNLRDLWERIWEWLHPHKLSSETIADRELMRDTHYADRS